MRPHIVDLNDAMLRIARGADELLQSPAYATFVNNQVELGDHGYAHAWLHPRQASNRFWHDLNTAPLTQFGKRVRHHGDLAFLHLQQLRDHAGRPASAIVVVPGTYQRAQLSLLLGIAEAAGLGVTALVDSAVAAGATLPPGLFTVAEVLLHQTVLTRIEVTADQVVRRHLEGILGAGLVHFEQLFVRVIVDAFLTRCRFDPLHDARTEQLLHTHLPAWLSLLAEQPEIILTIDHHGVRHQTRLQREALATAAAPLYQQITQRATGSALVIDHRLNTLPGARAGLRPLQVLAANAVFAGCVASPDLRDLAPHGGVNLRVSLARAENAPSAIVPPQSVAASPSHLLAQHTAYRLSAQPLYLTPRGAVHTTRGPEAVCVVLKDPNGAQIEVLDSAQVALNGRVISGHCALAVGDHISVPGAMALFVPITVTTLNAV